MANGLLEGLEAGVSGSELVPQGISSLGDLVLGVPLGYGFGECRVKVSLCSRQEGAKLLCLGTSVSEFLGSTLEFRTSGLV